MEFGKVQDPSTINFLLPPDDVMTEEVLRSSSPLPAEGLRLYVGATRWRIKDWLGSVYPKKTKEKDFLAKYVQQFNTIELNAMWYNLQPTDVIEKWAALADDSFRFCPKFSNTISHELQLKDAQRDTQLFTEHMRRFGKKLGSSFLQLSDGFGPDRTALLQHYLRQLPRDFQTNVELRQERWFDKDAHRDTWNLLRELGIGTVITDTSGRRDVIHMRLTTPVAFIRFVSNNGHPSDYTRLDAWAERLGKWTSMGLREVYFFMHAGDEAETPGLIDYTIQTLNKACGTNIPRPKLKQEDEATPLTLF